MKANTTPQNLTVIGKNKIELTDILVGDIWLCSGQSNMSFGIGGCNAPDDIKSADYPMIRMGMLQALKVIPNTQTVFSAIVQKGKTIR